MRQLALIPITALLAGCGVVDTLNQTTCLIHQNREAIECDTAVIYQNIEKIRQSNQAIERNRALLEELSKE